MISVCNKVFSVHMKLPLLSVIFSGIAVRWKSDYITALQHISVLRNKTVKFNLVGPLFN